MHQFVFFVELRVSVEEGVLSTGGKITVLCHE